MLQRDISDIKFRFRLSNDQACTAHREEVTGWQSHLACRGPSAALGQGQQHCEALGPLRGTEQLMERHGASQRPAEPALEVLGLRDRNKLINALTSLLGQPCF